MTVAHSGPGTLGFDDTEQIFKFGQMVWDSGTLTWVRMTQPGGGSGGGAATIADGADVAEGATTDAEAAAGNGSVIALLKRIRTLLGAPLAVTGTFFQGTQPVSLAAAVDVSDKDARILGRVKIHDGTDVALISAAGELAVQFLSAQAMTNANLDVALSTRLKPADTLAAVTSLTQMNGQAIAMGTGVRSAGTQRITVATDDSVPVTNANLDVALSTRLKPADTLAAVTSLTQMNGQAITMGTGVRAAGTLRVTVATDDQVQVVGELAADAVDSGNPSKIGGIARAALTAVSAALDRVNAMFDVYGRFIVAKKDTFAVQQQPAAATQATIAKASAGAGIKNVCTSITVTLSSTAAPTAARVIFNLRDGATGAGTILWSAGLSVPAVAGQAIAITLSDLWIEGTAATAMTLESAAAPGANTFATVAMTGTTTV